MRKTPLTHQQDDAKIARRAGPNHGDGAEHELQDPVADGTRKLEVTALLTDLYQLTMAQAYLAEEMHADAVFSLFVRRLPKHRNFLLAAGLGTLVGLLTRLRFTADDIEYLSTLDLFDDWFLDWLGNFRFGGQVRAMREGTPFFANEPILEVTGPIAEAQILETLVMNQIHLQTVLASKAVRIATAAAGRPVVDFGMRRMHGIDAALQSARAFHIAGIAATSDLAAGKLHDLPVTGTMAHSYVQAHETEYDSFKAFALRYPATTLLVDTYDTIAGVEKVIALANDLGEAFNVRAVRLDSGDLGALAKDARRRLDKAGLNAVQIFASSSLDEWKIAELLADGAPIDGFGVGTHMGVSSDAPHLDIAYKLCEYESKGRLKLSSQKLTLPGAKQVFRRYRDEQAAGDVVGRVDERLTGTPLLVEAMRDGRPLPAAQEALSEIRARAAREVAALPGAVRDPTGTDAAYPVEISRDLAAEEERLTEELRSR